MTSDAQPTTSGRSRAACFNDRVALAITGAVGSMWCCYLFALVSLTGLPAAIHDATAQASAGPFITWLSQQFIQLVLLPALMVGTNLASRTADARATRDDQLLQRIDLILEHHGIQLDAGKGEAQ